MISIGQGAGDQRLRGAQDRLLITRKELLKVSWISFREHILSVFRMLHQRNLAWWKKYEKEPLRAQIASDWWIIMDQWYSEAKQTQFLITFDTQLKIAPTAKIELND